MCLSLLSSLGGAWHSGYSEMPGIAEAPSVPLFTLLVNLKGHILNKIVLKDVFPLHYVPKSASLPFYGFVCAGGSKCLASPLAP